MLPVIGLLNICSLKKINSTNKKACTLLQEDITTRNMEIVIITETFLQPRVPTSYISIDGFDAFRRDRKICQCRRSNCSKAHKGGGILVYARSIFNCEIYDSAEDCESMWLKITKVHGDHNPCIFLNASYVPPSSDKGTIIDYLTKTTNILQEDYPGSVLVIGGDFNRTSLQELILDTGLTVLDSPPSRGEARLDLILTNKPELISSVSTFEASAETDHLGLITIPKFKLPPVRYLQNFRYFSFQGHEQLNKTLPQLNFAPLYNLTDANEAAEWLEMNIERCFTNAFPIKWVRMSNRDPNWITPKIKWLINKKKVSIKKSHHEKAEQYDKRIKAIRIKTLHQQGSKSWWNAIDSMTHRKHGSNKLSDQAFTPAKLNEDLALRCAIKRNEVRDPPPHFHLGGHETPTLSLNEVAYVIRSCKRTTAGPSNIPHFLFKDYWDILSQPYQHVWNLSLEKGMFPRCYKKADVIPIPKVKIATQSDDIRGISITSIAARLFEKVVHKKWITPKIIELGDPHQFAYKPNLSTSDCLLSLQHFILSSLDLQEVDGIHAAMIDYSKAFDRLNQEKAVKQQNKFIESPFIQKWLYDFSTERQQRLKWNGFQTKFLTVDRGCSQGTVGGPGIFSMYTDDIRVVGRTSVIFKYSDDTSCLTPCMKVPSNNDKVAFINEISSLMETSRGKDLEVNTNKSKHLRFSINRRPYCQCEAALDKFETVDTIKILGVIFQADCSFSRHCKHLLSCLRSLMYMFKDLQSQNVPIEDKQKVFEALVVSRIRYGLSIYGSDTSALKKVDSFLEKCYEKRICQKRISIYDLLKEEDHRNLMNILHNTNHPLHHYITKHKKARTTRHGFQYTRPNVNTDAFHKSFTNRILPC